MHRRTFIASIAAVVAAAPGASTAQPTLTLPRIGVLLQTPLDASPALKLLEPALRERGYSAGTDFTLLARSSSGKPEGLPGLAADLVRGDVNVIVAVGPAAVEAAIRATRSIPIVAIDLESDPVKKGWVRTLARPAGNVTGLFLDHPAMAGKWLDLLRETVRGVRQVVILWDSTTSTSPLDAAKAAARQLSISAEVASIRSIGDIDATLNAAPVRGAQALVMLSAPAIYAASSRIAEFTKSQHIPAISPFRPFAEAGGLMSYGPDLPYFFRRSAIYVDKILKGDRPYELAVELPTKFELVVNLKTANELGLTIPQGIVLRADDVIK